MEPHRPSPGIPEDACLYELVTARAAERPDALAAADGARRLAYAQLDRDANRVARDLLERGVEPEERIGVLADRSLEYVIGILGVLKAGGAYLPLDPHHPDERLDYLRESGDVRFVIGQARFAERAGAGFTALEAGMAGAEFAVAPARRAGPRNLAYVFYTSGSTGRPKGVQIEHRSVVNLIRVYQDVFGIGPDDRFSQIQRPGFDGSVAEIWPALASGASLHVPSEKTYLQPARLVQWLAEEGITICDVPTLLAESIVAETPPDGSRVRALVTGGDRLRRRPPPGFPWPVYDEYGPTENTVVSTIARVEPEGAEGPLHIGRPIANHRVLLLDAKSEPVAPGEIGEIHLGGIGLARGYLGSGAEAERFFPDPFAAEPDARLYRTGDLGRLLPDGNLQYLGRVDQQVKIRGFRVELAEIEQRLAEHPGVREALAQAVELPGGAKRLVAHYVRREAADPPRAELRAFLSDRVPHFMVPTWLVAVRGHSGTANGKIDRAALLASSDWRHARDAAPVPPRNAIDAHLAAIWAELLDVPEVGITDDFFELGGHSLAAAQVASRLEREIRADLPLALFFQAPTIEALSDHLRGERPIVTTPGLVPLTASGAKPPIFFLPGLGGHVLSFRALAQALGSDRPCFGLQDPALEGAGEPFATVERMAEHFVDLVRSVDTAEAPRLVGYSLGGLVALEMGRRLLRAGGAPPFVALIDTPAPGYPPRLPFVQRLAAHAGNVVRGDGAGRGAYLAARWQNLMSRFRGGGDEYEQAIWGVLTPRMKAVLAAHGRAGNAYVDPTYAGPIALLRARVHPDWPATSFDDPTLGWSRFVSGQIDTREIPGAHLDVLDEHHTAPLAQTLAEALAAHESAREP
ncbi:MAG TPA: amino acid adenylation domain-containing protein [Myxococcota bacterium]|nr:amino acid adenylation domain-containing protein [Myxococcota bacterium]